MLCPYSDKLSMISLCSFFLEVLPFLQLNRTHYISFSSTFTHSITHFAPSLTHTHIQSVTHTHTHTHTHSAHTHTHLRVCRHLFVVREGGCFIFLWCVSACGPCLHRSSQEEFCCTYTHTHTHTHTRAHTHTQKKWCMYYTHIRTYIHMKLKPHYNSHIHTVIHVHAYIHRFTYMLHIHIIPVHTHTRTYL